MKKRELLSLAENRRVRLEAVLARFSPAQLTEPGIQGKWSFKDLLVHIIYADRQLIRELESAARGEQIEAQSEDRDTINARVYEATHDRPLPTVIADFRGTFQHLVSIIA